MLDTPSESGESCVLGSTILRSQNCLEFNFCSKNAIGSMSGEKMWDVSAAHDRSIFGMGNRRFSFILNCCMNYNIASDTKIKLQNARGLFWGYENLCEINLDKWIDSSSVSDMSYMFCGCHSLKKLDVSGLDTSNVVNMEGMFYWCSKFQTLDVSYFDTSHVINMKSMFDYCSSLKKIGFEFILYQACN